MRRVVVASACQSGSRPFKATLWRLLRPLKLHNVAAPAGAQGTLGGLVEIAGRIPDILLAALDQMRLCSNDPVCADHDPSVTGDERSLSGAACHACLLIPETSCEARNVYLDRALLVETVAQTRAGLFG